MLQVAIVFVLSLLAVGQRSTAQLGSKDVVSTHHQGQGLCTTSCGVQETQTSTTSGYNKGDKTCASPWLFPQRSANGSTTCECGSGLGGVVKCNSTTQQVLILTCYCMTYDIDESELIAGECFSGCFTKRSVYHFPYFSPYYPLPSNITQLNEVCADFHRDGQLCGKCMDGFAPPVYSYNSSCVNCTEYSSNWAKYLTVSFLPLTALFAVVVIFRVSAASGLLNVFVFVCQTVTTPAAARVFANVHIGPSTTTKLLSYTLVSLYGVWNLDFFRLLYSPFCLHPKMTTLQALALDYAIAAYPLFLIIITYLLVEMHDHNFRILVWLWKPFHTCFVGFRREWNIRGSMINAFATFLLLSYVKFLSVSFDLLILVSIFDMHGQKPRKLYMYLYYDGTVEYFGQKHLPFAVLALIVLVVFIVFPFLLLFLYPNRCFQRCLNHYNVHYQMLHTFMDAFQGSYKDGSNGTCDCRWFSALYLMLRLTYLAVFANVMSNVILPILILVTLVPVFLTGIFHPHKFLIYNIVDSFLLLVLVSFATSIAAVAITDASGIHSATISNVLVCIFSPIPLLYLIAVLLYKLLAHKRVVQKACQNVCALIPCHFRETDQINFERALHTELSMLMSIPLYSPLTQLNIL